MAQPDDSSAGESRSWWIMAGVLGALCLMIRMQGLLALPIFGDEAIYLRWAQLIREGHWWVSLCDPKPPVHFWLMAVVMKVFGDPLASVRMISVVAGVLSVPAVMLVCEEFGEFLRPGKYAVSGRAMGMVAAVLMIFCPFLSFYQRLATADALFVLEMLVAAWLALRWARRAIEGENAWGTAVALGAAIGVAMMTRQGLSYTLWGLPVVAVCLRLIGPAAGDVGQGMKPKVGGRVARVVGQFVVALLVAGVIWMPFLVADFGRLSAENGGTGAELKRRILYQEQFTAGKVSHAQIAGRNFQKAFVLSHSDENGRVYVVAARGWFFIYMTPGVFVVCLIGLVFMGVERNFRALFFLVAWLVLMLGPVVVMGNVIYSRYVLAGAPVFLMAGAWMVTDLMAALLSLRRLRPWLKWGLCAAGMGGLLFLPLREVGRQTKEWSHQTLTPQDRYQYVTGWASGYAARGAIRALARHAQAGMGGAGPIVVITDNGWGNPADAAWVYLSEYPNVTVYYRDGERILDPVEGQAGKYWLRREKFLFTPREAVAIDPKATVFVISSDPIHTRTGDVRAEDYFRKANPNIGAAITFDGIEGEKSEDRVVLMPVDAVAP